MLSTATPKPALLMSDATPLSVMSSFNSDPFKSHIVELREYGVSDVTSDESTDRSLSSPVDPSFPFNGGCGGDGIPGIPPMQQPQQKQQQQPQQQQERRQKTPQHCHYQQQQQLKPAAATLCVPITLPWQTQDDLNISILKLYEKLLPTQESYDRRRQFVRKIETLLKSEWPGHDIRVHVFGSMENGLGTRTSDVDICLTTAWPHLEYLPILASALKRHGMHRVYMVPHAKVPIVKMWDPQLQLACDMNVNNTLALQNTKMIKTYCAIDARVRPLAMVIKYWAKQRGLNDAADGGTLSTYTWTCMVINFLQMREPPILPVLHQIDHVKSADNLVIAGHDTSFYTDANSLRHFGQRNRETVAGLLYAFFRRYAYEFDYETQVVSVRHGRYLSKVEKGWHDGCYDRLFLCVEEPFNVARNLGNSADLASVLGLQREFRRAVHIILETERLEALCAPYINRLYPTFATYPFEMRHIPFSAHNRMYPNMPIVPRRNSSPAPSNKKQQPCQRYQHDEHDNERGKGGHYRRRHSCAVTHFSSSDNRLPRGLPPRKRIESQQQLPYQSLQQDSQHRPSYAANQLPYHHANGTYPQQPQNYRRPHISAQPQQEQAQRQPSQAKHHKYHRNCQTNPRAS
ncbi:hypothetical protein BX666DRAFT_1335410 [Dichotomocladium elegans]|nr:hypothetical protein BX666DRAFT_1335410 [Dichotomocladium elegans]